MRCDRKQKQPKPNKKSQKIDGRFNMYITEGNVGLDWKLVENWKDSHGLGGVQNDGDVVWIVEWRIVKMKMIDECQMNLGSERRESNAKSQATRQDTNTRK